MRRLGFNEGNGVDVERGRATVRHPNRYKAQLRRGRWHLADQPRTSTRRELAQTEVAA